MASLAGTKIDKYDMIEEVGHGGMAVVYRGLDRVLKREVAVKVLHPHLADREESRLRLQREAIAVAKLRHENILEIFDYSGPEAEASYIVTEFIHGMTLKEWVDDKLDPRPAVAALIVHRLCLALQHAHRTGIVHRDIKPENVMIREDGVLKLMDFGIAQIIDNQKLTLTGQLIGSPAYMAPELISGRPLDQRTDLFSLGILLYQLATGRLPFFGRNPHEVLNRIADGEYPPAATICPLVDRDLEDIIALSLASDPDERYQSVETFGQELHRYLEECGVEATNAELGRYFRAPEDYIEQLDEHVCTVLTDRAKAAASAGETARAIRLLGRVLEFDATHAGATLLLERLRKRERRNRRLMMVGAGVVTFGAVLGIASVIPEGSEVDQGERTTAANAAALERVDDSAGSGVVAAAGDATTSAALPEAAVSSSGRSEDEPEADSGSGSGSDDGEPPDTGANGAASDHPDRKRHPSNKPKTPTKTACTLSIAGGIPLPTAQNLSLNVGGQLYDIEGKTVDVEFDGEFTAVRVNDKRWTASRKITISDCEAGPVPVAIKPLAARVKFKGRPGPSQGLVVICREGCRASLQGRNQNAKDFQAVPIPTGKAVQHVKLELKAEHYEAKIIERDLLPGPNEIEVYLVKHSAGG